MKWRMDTKSPARSGRFALQPNGLRDLFNDGLSNDGLSMVNSTMIGGRRALANRSTRIKVSAFLAACARFDLASGLSSLFWRSAVINAISLLIESPFPDSRSPLHFFCAPVESSPSRARQIFFDFLIGQRLRGSPLESQVACLSFVVKSFYIHDHPL